MGGWRTLGPEQPVVVGSRFCPRFAGWADAEGDYHAISDDDTLRQCFDTAASGPTAYDGECLTIEGPGEVAWRVEPRDDACTDQGFGPDRLRFEAVALDGVVTEDAAIIERFALGGRIDDPAPWIGALGEPLVVVEDVVVIVGMGLRDPVRDAPVAWPRSEEGVVVTPYAHSAFSHDPTFRESREQLALVGAAALRLPPASTAEVALQIGELTAPALTVESVGVDEVSDLAIVDLSRPADNDDPWRSHLLRAVGRDPDGRVVRGIPVMWALESELEIEAAPPVGLGDPDFLQLTLPCREDDSAEAEYGRVTATLGEQSAVFELSWERPPCSGGDHRDPEGDDGDPRAGCGCRIGGDRTPLLLCVAALTGCRRRRRAAPPRTSSRSPGT